MLKETGRMLHTVEFFPWHSELPEAAEMVMESLAAAPGQGEPWRMVLAGAGGGSSSIPKEPPKSLPDKCTYTILFNGYFFHILVLVS